MRYLEPSPHCQHRAAVVVILSGAMINFDVRFTVPS